MFSPRYSLRGRCYHGPHLRGEKQKLTRACSRVKVHTARGAPQSQHTNPGEPESAAVLCGQKVLRCNAGSKNGQLPSSRAQGRAKPLPCPSISWEGTPAEHEGCLAPNPGPQERRARRSRKGNGRQGQILGVDGPDGEEPPGAEGKAAGIPPTRGGCWQDQGRSRLGWVSCGACCFPSPQLTPNPTGEAPNFLLTKQLEEPAHQSPPPAPLWGLEPP